MVKILSVRFQKKGQLNSGKDRLPTATAYCYLLKNTFTMKILTTFIISTLFTLTMFGQTETETIKKANDLIAGKKYESAYNLLDKFDPNNRNPDIVLLKEDIALNYFVSSIMHQTFAFLDLKENENIMNYRGKEGQYEMKLFEIDKILDSLITIYPTNCKLYKGLGDFYYQVNLKYGNNWFSNNDELFELIETNYKKAIEGHCEDFLSYFVIGYIYIVKEKYTEGIPYFQKSIALNKDYASSYYNLAYAYLNLNNGDSVLKYAKHSLDIDTEISYKSDAARMLGQVYASFNDDENAVKNYELADKIDSGNYYNIKLLLYLYVKTGNPKTGETTLRFFNLEPVNPTIYNDLEEIYYNNKKEDYLMSFYKEQLEVYKDNQNVLGNLNFFLGKMYLDSDKKLAKDYFLKAKDIFINVYDKDHPVFKVIEEGITQAEN